MQDSGSKATYVVGLTGGIGCGKSTISDLFTELGAEVIDADKISHAIVEKDMPLFGEVVDHFGPGILGSDGELNRSRIRDIIFNDPGEKKWLEGLLHPAIRNEIRNRIAASRDEYVILTVPLLLESGNYDFVDRILVVDVPESIQIARIRHRDDMPVELIRRIIDSQMPREERLDKADDIIFNDAPIDEIKEHVRKLHGQYREAGMERKARAV